MTTRDEDLEYLARLSARVRRLTDPAAAKGLRSSRQRIQRERRARNALAAVALGIFLAVTGLIASNPPQADAPTPVVIVQGNDAPQQAHIRTKSS